MKVRSLLLVNLLVAALMAAYAFWAAGQLPPGTELPTHWNAAGEIDDTMPALQALLLPAGIALFIGLVFAVIPAIEPLQHKLEGSAPLLRASWVATLALMVVLQGFVSAPIFGASPGPGVIIVLVGLLFVVLGNMLPKSRPGFFVGIRTPWTITDADNWIATHRLGGKLFLLAGIAMILAGLLDISSEARVFVVLGSTIAAAAIPMVYSWWLWRSGRVERG
tara:strand:+ start:39 stop:701 length:663 start_codon:yes stop_codon:yes gene_type:complete